MTTDKAKRTRPDLNSRKDGLADAERAAVTPLQRWLAPLVDVRPDRLRRAA